MVCSISYMYIFIYSNAVCIRNADRSTLKTLEAGTEETVLKFWQRKSKNGEFKYLPQVARVLFALPSSSAQIERDFGVCGDLVSSHRVQIADEYVDMASFINRNRPYLDITQSPCINSEDLKKFIPMNIQMSFEDRDLTELVTDVFECNDDDDDDEQEL